MATLPKLAPLDIKCTATDCDDDLHCFKKLKKMTPAQHGSCRACGAKLVDWSRVHRRDLADTEHTFQALKRELIRHHFFHVEIDDDAIRHARRKGRIKLKDAARNRLRTSIGRAQPFRDGTQTPKNGNAIYYAQHATATCCRTCLEYWHAIPKGRELTEVELEYCAELIDLFLDERLPNLDDKPVKVPVRRKTRSNVPRLL